MPELGGRDYDSRLSRLPRAAVARARGRDRRRAVAASRGSMERTRSGRRRRPKRRRAERGPSSTARGLEALLAPLRQARWADRRRRLRARVFAGRIDVSISRHAVRGLGATPSFTVIALIVLTLGIGATTAIFSVVDAVVLRRYPFRRARSPCRGWRTLRPHQRRIAGSCRLASQSPAR